MTVLREKCYVCGQAGDFEITDGSVLLREAVCPHCGSSIRHSDVAQTISDRFSWGGSLAQAVSEMKEIRILDTSPLGESYRLLSQLPGCVGSEYFPDVQSGNRAENGILCVDLTQIPFPDHTFDLVITEEVLEHISDLERAFSEISRVLKPGGVHIFTIPVCETVPTRPISDLNVTHPAISGSDARVFHEFGLDIANILEKFGFSTQYRMAHRFCAPAHTTNLRENYVAYCESRAEPLKFFQYNSIVFTSEKVAETKNAVIERVEIQTTEYVQVVMEHLHRYQSVQNLVDGKIVLDAACGSGYGTKLLAERAEKVVGIDIDAELIKRLQKEETQNTSFCCMSVTEMDFADNSFDAVVSFETIEHIDEAAQKAFLKEARRVLKPDGCLIISTPNVEVLKKVYSDYYNPFHVKEHTRDEFYALLRPYFKYIQEYYQNVMEASCISSAVESVSSNPIEAVSGKYLIAVCSNCVLPANLLRSAFFPAAETYYNKLHQSITGIAKLYIDNGGGFREENIVTAECNYQKGYFHIIFDTIKFQNVQALRFDPLEGTFCRVHINICRIDGIPYPVEVLNAAEHYETFDYFFHGDPQYLIQASNKRITKVEVEGYLDYRVSKRISQVYGSCREQKICIAEKDCELQKMEGLLADRGKRIDFLSEALAGQEENNKIITRELSLRQEEINALIEKVSALQKSEQTLNQQLAHYQEHYHAAIAQREELKRELAQAQYAYSVVSNAFFWKITKPARILTDALKSLLKRNRYTRLLCKGLRCWKQNGFFYTWRKFQDKVHYRQDYTKVRNPFTTEELERQKRDVFSRKIKFSILVPLYNTPEKFLREMLQSVLDQTYGNWELCLADGSDEQHREVEKICGHYARKDARIQYRRLKRNLGISGNTNACIEMASGDYIALLDHDDLLHPAALHEVMTAICKQSADFIYTDENTFHEKPEDAFCPHFKPDYAPDTLRGNNYICHLTVFCRNLLEKVGGFRSKCDGSQDFDMVLRLTEQARRIVHIPHILYYWRAHKDSVADSVGAKPYVIEAAHQAIQDHLARLGMEGTVLNTVVPSIYRIRYKIKGTPLVSILIPNFEHVEDLKKCLESLFFLTTYPNFEIIVIENNSTGKAVFAYYREIRKKWENVKVVTWEGRFNYSAINNFGARNFSRGEYILLLNNDTEIISPDWIQEMLMFAQREDVGAVGAKLYYPDNTIQHAGIGIGLLTLAGHLHRGFDRQHPGYMGRLAYAQNLSAVTAACIMIRRDVWDEVNGLDEEFEVAFNDVDLCMRIRKAGYLIVWTPYAELYHYESKSRGYEDTPEKQKRFSSEVLRFQQRWNKELKAGDPYYNLNLTLDKEDFSLR